MSSSNAPTAASSSSQLAAIAGNTYTESVRQPIHTVLLLCGIGLQAVNPALSAYTLGDDNQLLLDLGLSSIFLVGMLLAAFSAASALGDEVRRQTVLTVVSKPIPRSNLIVGKFVGIVGAVGVAWAIWSLAFLLALRHQVLMRATDVFDEPVLIFGGTALGGSLGIALWRNWRHRRPFPSSLVASLAILAPLGTLLALSFDKEWNPQAFWVELDADLLWTLLLLLEGMAILAAVALAAATRLGTMATLAITVVVFALGLVGETLAGGSTLRNLLPNLQILWLSDALVRGAQVGSGYALLATAWFLLYTGGILAVAVALFRGRDLG